MNMTQRTFLLAEREAIKRMLAETPVTAILTRMSDEARLREIEVELAALSESERPPARARLTFNGLPVIGSHGIFADFGMKAVSSFTDAVATVAASLSAPLEGVVKAPLPRHSRESGNPSGRGDRGEMDALMDSRFRGNDDRIGFATPSLAATGPIPNRDQNQLLITNTAVGSFGFELEEYRAQERPDDESAVAVALERTQSLLQATLGQDDELADIASETDPRALDKVRSFLRVLADNGAICTLQYSDKAMRFTDPGQVRRSLARLAADNLRESQQTLEGEFVGVLPVARSFEFKLAGNEEIVRGKISPNVGDVETLNDHLYQRVRVEAMRTQVGNGRPRFLLTRMPQWAADTAPTGG
jgi:hypothetical protein